MWHFSECTHQGIVTHKPRKSILWFYHSIIQKNEKKKIQFCNYSVNTVFQFGSKLYSSLKSSLVVEEVWNLCSHPFPFCWGHRRNKFHQFQGEINCGWEIKNTFNLSTFLTFVSQNYYFFYIFKCFWLHFFFWLKFFVSRKCSFECLSAGSVPFSISLCVFFFCRASRICSFPH